MNEFLVIGSVVAGLFAITFLIGELTAKRRTTRHQVPSEFDTNATFDAPQDMRNRP